MPYQILYLPGFTGRAEPAIMLLEDADAPYEIVSDDVRERVAALAVDHPVFACPILIDEGTVVSQTSVITEYLGHKHGYDVDESLRVPAAQLAYNVADIWRETYVGRKNNDPTYLDDRFTRWVSVLENSFSNSADDGFFLSDAKPTYVDFLVLNIVTLADYCWGAPAATEIYAQPRLGSWAQRMLARPRIKAYFDKPSLVPVGYEAVKAVA